MKTGSWFTWRGEGRIGISLGTPRGQPAGFRLYRPLNPTRPMLSMGRAEYEVRYFEMLAEFDPQKVWDDLHRMAGGAEPVILCYENPNKGGFNEGNWCHRRLAAKWLGARLDQEIPEIGFDGPDLLLTPEGQEAFIKAIATGA